MKEVMINNSAKGLSFERLAHGIAAMDCALREDTVRAINSTATLRNWLIGAYIVEYEQNGSDRAKYGDSLLKELERRVCRSGLTVTLFQTCRRFYRLYPQVAQEALQIYATLSHKSRLLLEKGVGEEHTHDCRATDLADMFAQSGKPEKENRQRLAEIGREI